MYNNMRKRVKEAEYKKRKEKKCISIHLKKSESKPLYMKRFQGKILKILMANFLG